MKTSTLVLMGGLCFVLPACGSLGSGGGGAAGAAKTAESLAKDIHGAGEKLKELAEVLQTSGDRLGKKEFPSDLAMKLGVLNIPFDASNLSPEVARLPGRTVKQLFDYTMEVQNLNESKDKLKNMLTVIQPVVEKAFKEEKEPVVTFSVLVHPEGAKGMVAELVPNKDPFKLDGDWPKDYVVVSSATAEGRPRPTEKQVKRWEKGAVSGPDPVAIPVSPPSMAFAADKAVLQLRMKLVEQIDILTGGDKGTPQETPGLIKKGEDLENELKKIALAK